MSAMVKQGEPAQRVLGLGQKEAHHLLLPLCLPNPPVQRAFTYLNSVCKSPVPFLLSSPQPLAKVSTAPWTCLFSCSFLHNSTHSNFLS